MYAVQRVVDCHASSNDEVPRSFAMSEWLDCAPRHRRRAERWKRQRSHELEPQYMSTNEVRKMCVTEPWTCMCMARSTLWVFIGSVRNAFKQSCAGI